MATAASIIRQIQALIGDQNGRLVSKELIVDTINEESLRVFARFPSEVRITTDQEESDSSYGITSADLVIERLSIQKVFLDGYEATKTDSFEMERVTLP